MIIDTVTFCAWRNEAEIISYLPAAWREYVGEAGSLPGGHGVLPFLPSEMYQNPLGEAAQDVSVANGAPAGSSAEDAERDIFGGTGEIASAVVLPEQRVMWLPSIPNPRLARQVSVAYNEWLADQWLARQDGTHFKGVALLPVQVPEDAVAEIERLAGRSGFWGVLVGVNALHRRLGHPVYRPVLRAAAEAGFPVIVHVGIDSAPDVLTSPVAGGPALTFGEFDALQPSALMSHVASLVIEGVFEKVPDLRVLLVGGGSAWLPGLLMRMDHEYKGLRRDVPWLRKAPSEYCESKLWLSTYPFESAISHRQLGSLLTMQEWLPRALCYGSGYPRRDMNSVQAMSSMFSADDWSRVGSGNALELFGNRS